MPTIDIDFDVYKALTVRRATESVTYNAVIRELLGLDPVASTASAGVVACNLGGVEFPEGTQFRRTYKGQTYFAEIKDGALTLNGERQSSLSAAAYAITNGGVNGWWFWEVKRPGDPEWRMAGDLRTAAE